MDYDKKANNQITRAISIRQPHAEAILLGGKDIEYRSRKTNIRERLYIYASKTREHEEVFANYRIQSNKVAYGVMIGTVEIIDCQESTEYDGYYEWMLARPKRLKTYLKPINQPQPSIWIPQF